MKKKIHFFAEEVNFKLKKKSLIRKWIKKVATKYKFKITEINFIFCHDAYLLTINKQYLNHNTYTDIITFDNSEKPQKLQSDIFISIERVKENANKLNIPFENELHRVMIHGILHLLGHKDKTQTDKAKMTQAEDDALKSPLLSKKRQKTKSTK